MSLVRRSNVFDPFADFWDPFDVFRSVVPAALTDRDTAAFAGARIDWKETPEAHVFKADLPGVKKEEVKVEVEDGNVLVISGERSREKEDKNDKWHRVERSSGENIKSFSCMFDDFHLRILLFFSAIFVFRMESSYVSAHF